MGRVITLCTDFGTRDGYVAAMKGVVLGIAPEATIIDITHEIEPQNVAAAAFVLQTTCPYFPDGTVHLVVVDPGVGSHRRAIAVRTARFVYVAPDNGVLTRVLREDPALEVVSLESGEYRLSSVSRTFHGRDIFAPAAAHIARGVAMNVLGPSVEGVRGLEWPSPRRAARGEIEGCVVHIDRFGNLITNIPATMFDEMSHARCTLVVGCLRIEGVSDTYADVDRGEAIGVIGGHGYLEIAAREGSAAQVAGVNVGAVVRVVANEDAGPVIH